MGITAEQSIIIPFELGQFIKQIPTSLNKLSLFKKKQLLAILKIIDVKRNGLNSLARSHIFHVHISVPDSHRCQGNDISFKCCLERISYLEIKIIHRNIAHGTPMGSEAAEFVHNLNFRTDLH